ncbi:hypothetical protein VPH35_128925 [Triticum aestivum]
MGPTLLAVTSGGGWSRSAQAMVGSAEELSLPQAACRGRADADLASAIHHFVSYQARQAQVNIHLHAKILMNVFIRKPTHAMEFAKISLEHFTAAALMGHMGTPL